MIRYVNPKHMCDKHLHDEHAYIHNVLTQIKSGKIDEDDYPPLKARHDELVPEIELRGLVHHCTPVDKGVGTGEEPLNMFKAQLKKDLFELCDTCYQIFLRNMTKEIKELQDGTA